MRIAVLSDTHSRYQTVEKALALLRDLEINWIVHCGDIEDAETVRLFKGFTTHFVFGNCDWEKAGLQIAMQEMGFTLHQHFGNLVLDGVKLAWTHGDDKRLLWDIENSGHYDFLFYGHTHVAEQHRAGPTLVVNPGALFRARPKSFILLDLGTRLAESLQVE